MGHPRLNPLHADPGSLLPSVIIAAWTVGCGNSDLIPVPHMRCGVLLVLPPCYLYRRQQLPWVMAVIWTLRGVSPPGGLSCDAVSLLARLSLAPVVLPLRGGRSRIRWSSRQYAGPMYDLARLSQSGTWPASLTCNCCSNSNMGAMFSLRS